MQNAELFFRAADESDVPALVELIESAYRGDSSRAGWTTEAHLLEGQRTDPQGVAAVIKDADSRMLAVERSGELIACCQLENRAESTESTEDGEGDESGPGGPGGVAYFGMFAVRPGLQGGGLGKLIIAEAERIARTEWGAREMQMTVITQRNDLIAWYERRGYTRTGQLSPFPYGDERFGLPQRADLAFELLVKPLVP